MDPEFGISGQGVDEFVHGAGAERDRDAAAGTDQMVAVTGSTHDVRGVTTRL